MSETRYRVVVAGGVTLAVGLLVFAALSADDGMDDEVRESGATDDFVESLSPGRDDEALRQEGVTIDLVAGWTGYLVVAQEEVRTVDQGLVERPELAQLSFIPGEGRIIERWPTGVNCVTAVVWKVSESEDTSRNVTWCFDVT